MARVLSLSSQVVYGPVGNTASVPPLQKAGHDVMQLPTIVLSHHPGHGPPAAQRVDDQNFFAMIDALRKTGALKGINAVMTGYFASVEQVMLAANLIKDLRKQNGKLVVLIDPILGDHGRLYVAEDIATAIRSKLLPLADITTPNCFELSWLSGMPVESIEQAKSAAAELRVGEVIAKSIPNGDDLVTLLLAGSSDHQHHRPKLARVPHGVGDFLAGAYLAQRLSLGVEDSFRAATAQLDSAIARSSGEVLTVT